MKKTLIFAGICMSTIFTNAFAETNNILMSRGEWQDPKTKLIWMRCTLGQKWNGKTCTGNGILFTSEDAKEYLIKFINSKNNYELKKQWRIPSSQDFAKIRTCSKGWYKDILQKTELTEKGRVSKDIEVTRLTQINNINLPALCSDESDRPAINTTIFPNLPKISEKESERWQQFYWTSSETESSISRNINIYNGLLGFSSKQDRELDKMWEKAFKSTPPNSTQYVLLVRYP